MFAILILTLFPSGSLAAEGDCGYEGGISSGEAVAKEYDYQEMVFVTGKPIVVKGTVTVKKNIKNTSESWTYVYNNLKNTDEKVTLNRTVAYNVTVTQKSNGQVQKQVELKGIPYETIRVDNVTYSLDARKCSFSKSTIVDVKSISQYFAGEFLSRKTYNIIGGTGTASGTVTVNADGKIYGYNQYWSNSEAQTVNYTIDITKGKTSWKAKANTAISMTVSKEMSYEENKPDEISFEGGYVERQNNVAILQYSGEFPELDANGMPTDYILKPRDTLKYDTLPKVSRLVVPSLRLLKGHWAEEDVKLLYSLEVFKDNPEEFKPNDYTSRAEFAKAIILAGKLLSEEEIALADANPLTGNTAGGAQAKKGEVQIFDDVPLDHPYFTYIKEVYNRKIMDGVSLKNFWPESTITRAQAVTLIIRALGFEGRAPGPTAVTSFSDNDDIPSWARNAVYVAEKIGLIKGDTYGNMNPNKPMTKGETAALLNRLINYMRKDIAKDYRENTILY